MNVNIYYMSFLPFGYEDTTAIIDQYFCFRYACNPFHWPLTLHIYSWFYIKCYLNFSVMWSSHLRILLWGFFASQKNNDYLYCIILIKQTIIYALIFSKFSLVLTDSGVVKFVNSNSAKWLCQQYKWVYTCIWPSVNFWSIFWFVTHQFLSVNHWNHTYGMQK